MYDLFQGSAIPEDVLGILDSIPETGSGNLGFYLLDGFTFGL